MTQELAAEEWLIVADQELARTRRFLAHDDTFAAYCLESAVETYLRARYSAVGEAAPEDATLADLARHAFPTGPTGIAEACERIARLSAAARSGAGHDPELTDIRALLATIEPMLGIIRDGIRGESREET